MALVPNPRVFLFLFLVFHCFEKLKIFAVQNCRQKWFSDGLEVNHEGNEFGGDSSFVCVCSAGFCDEPEPVGDLAAMSGQIVLFVSDRRQKRLHRELAAFQRGKNHSKGPMRIVVDPSVHFQTLLGFGGAFTDSVGINLNRLSPKAAKNLLRAYFDVDRGIGYRIGRVPIASTDFSTREYSYLDEEGDFELETFALPAEDFNLKIPYIQMANQLNGGNLSLLAVPWAAPGWMKTNGRMSGPGELKGDLHGPYYRTYARYLKRFFDEYTAHGINFSALTLQNHPEGGLEENFPFQTMFMANHTQREFATRLLMPILRESPHTADLKLFGYDNPRDHFVSSMHEIFSSEHEQQQQVQSTALSIGRPFCHLLSQIPLLPAFLLTHINNLLGCSSSSGSQHPGSDSSSSPITGVGIHWYQLNGHEVQSEVHRMFPNKLILSVEACTGFSAEDAGPRLGNWTRGWMYGHDIVQNMRNWAVGWLDWNLCLDMEGGPNWVRNFVDSPIIVNPEKDEFYKQPMFYFLAHFSHFVPPGSIRIDSQLDEEEQQPSSSDRAIPVPPVDHVAFVTPEGDNVLVLVSPPGMESPIDLQIRDARSGNMATIKLEPESIMTAIFK